MANVSVEGICKYLKTPDVYMTGHNVRTQVMGITFISDVSGSHVGRSTDLSWFSSVLPGEYQAIALKLASNAFSSPIYHTQSFFNAN
jgi:hypothetical protein